jgi:hypothetical protein
MVLSENTWFIGASDRRDRNIPMWLYGRYQVSNDTPKLTVMILLNMVHSCRYQMFDIPMILWGLILSYEREHIDILLSSLNDLSRVGKTILRHTKIPVLIEMRWS